METTLHVCGAGQEWAGSLSDLMADFEDTFTVTRTA